MIEDINFYGSLKIRFSTEASALGNYYSNEYEPKITTDKKYRNTWANSKDAGYVDEIKSKINDSIYIDDDKIIKKINGFY